MWHTRRDVTKKNETNFGHAANYNWKVMLRSVRVTYDPSLPSLSAYAPVLWPERKPPHEKNIYMSMYTLYIKTRPADSVLALTYVLSRKTIAA